MNILLKIGLNIAGVLAALAAIAWLGLQSQPRKRNAGQHHQPEQRDQTKLPRARIGTNGSEGLFEHGGYSSVPSSVQASAPKRRAVLRMPTTASSSRS